MKTEYKGRDCLSVSYFNQINYPNLLLTEIEKIKEFLIKEGYFIKDYDSSDSKSLTIDKGSVNGAKSFIDYKSPLFKDVKFQYDSNGIVYITKIQ
jgi:hypothetical protein